MPLQRELLGAKMHLQADHEFMVRYQKDNLQRLYTLQRLTLRAKALMYQIYSMNRPGSPRWALAAAAGLLLIALALAALLIRFKARSQIVILETTNRPYPAGGVSVRLPEGWKRLDDDLDPGYVVGARTKDADQMLMVFRGVPNPLGVPSIEGRRALTEAIGEDLEAIESAPGQLGSLPGWTCLFASPGSLDRHRRVYYLGRSAIAPDGQVLGILLLIPRKPRRSDRQLLDDLSRHLSLYNLAVTEKPLDLMSQAGLTFEPPEGAKFFAFSDEPTIPQHLLRMTGGIRLNCWYLDVARVPLIGERTISELVEDYTLSTLQKVALDEPIQTSTIAGRSVAQTSWDLESANDPGVMVWCAKVDEHTGLMMIGRYEKDAKTSLHSIAEMIITTASVDSYKTSLDFADAQSVARDWLSELSNETLSSKWQHLANQSETYTSRAPTLPMFGEVCSYQINQEDNGAALWEIQVTQVPLGSTGRTDYNIQERWSISNSGIGHQQWYQEKIKGFPKVVYTEKRSAQMDQVVCELQVGDDALTQWQADIDSVYGCQPVLLQAGANVASDPLERPAIFTATKPFIPRATYWIMTPAGMQNVPNPKSDKRARAVKLVRDYNPTPITLYYDEANMLLYIAVDHMYWKERTGPQE